MVTTRSGRATKDNPPTDTAAAASKRSAAQGQMGGVETDASLASKNGSSRAPWHAAEAGDPAQAPRSEAAPAKRRRLPGTLSPSPAHDPHTRRPKHPPPPPPPSSHSPSPPSLSSLPSSALPTLHNILSPLSSNNTACPSQLARALYTREADWRAAMPAVRDLVWACAQRGWVEVTQKGEVRAYEAREGVRGPVRVKKGPRWEEFVWGRGLGGLMRGGEGEGGERGEGGVEGDKGDREDGEQEGAEGVGEVK